MSTDYILHYAPDNASLVIRLALSHLGEPFETRLVLRGADAPRSARFLEINPLGQIPVLETPEGGLSETAAILLWLSDRHGELIPSHGAANRGRALKWLFFLSNSLHAQLNQLFYTRRFIAEAHVPTLRAGIAKRVQADFKRLDAMAQDGDLFGTPECIGLTFYAACLFRFAYLYPLDMTKDHVQPQDYPALMQVFQQIEDLPTTHAAQRAEGLGPTPFTSPHPANPPEGSAT